jgi:hypothetical protein
MQKIYYRFSTFQAHLGAQTLLATEEDRIVIDTTDFKVHESYNPLTIVNDIALVFFTEDYTANGIHAYSVAKLEDLTLYANFR